MKHLLLVRYGEVHLKGLNRPYFIRALMQQVRAVLRPIQGIRLWQGEGRFYVEGYPEAREAEIAQAVCRVFGVHSVSPAVGVDKDLDVITEAACAMMREAGMTEGSFKVYARRSDKKFPMNSMEIAQDMGGRLLERFPGLSVDLHHPRHQVCIEVREEAFVYCRELPGAGGMPVGTGGRAGLLLSGGIDSPVAGYLLAKRGVEVDCIHFHSFPFTSERSLQKVLDLAQILADYTGRVHVHVVNFTPIQETLYEKGEENLLTILMRRYMMRIAEGVAREAGCQALATGESIGQVASQTMPSLVVTDETATMPVFRPLICFDKQETIDLAQRIGTFETSVLPYEDCCTVFVPKHPATRPSLDKVEAAEARLPDMDEMVRTAIATAEDRVLERRPLQP